MNDTEPFQLAPGPQWFFVRVRGRAWGLAVEARSAYEAVGEALRLFAVEGMIASRDACEAVWLPADVVEGVSRTLAARQPPQPLRPGKVAKPRLKRPRSA